MPQRNGSVIIAGLGATHPPEDEIRSLDQVLDALKRWRIPVADNDRKKMLRAGMFQRWNTQLSSDELALLAARQASNQAGLLCCNYAIEKVGLVYCGGATLSRAYPAQSVYIASELGIPSFSYQSLDISGACSSLAQAVATAEKVMRFDGIEWGLIAGGEAMLGRGVDPRKSGINTGLWDNNGAAAVLSYQAAGNPNFGIIHSRSQASYATYAESNGSGSDYVPALNLDAKALPNIRQLNDPNAELTDGDLLYRFVLDKVPQMVRAELRQLGLTPGDRTFLVPHGANARMCDSVGDDLCFREDNVLTLLGENGRSNMSSVSWLSTLQHYSQTPGFFQKDDVLVIVTFSAGLLVDIIIYRVGSNDYFCRTA